MKIINDPEKKYHEDVLTNLRKHNNKFAGHIPYGERFFYIVEDNELKAGAKINYSWSWCSFNLLHYRNIDDLKLLVQSIQLFFKDKVTGLKFFTQDPKKLEDMKKVGFIFEARLKGTKKVKDSLYAVNTHFTNLELDTSSVIESKEGIEEYTKVLKEKVDQTKEEEISNYVSYIALDGETFAGGVVGYITDDSLYVELLVVSEQYKGQGIGTLLMDALEEDAVSKGVIIMSLGTTEFQAKPFYEKRGYELIMTLSDYPKGYECYTMQKRL